MTTEIRGCKIVGGYVGPGPGLSGGRAMAYDAALAQKQQAEAETCARAHTPIDISIRRLWNLASHIGDASSAIEAVVDRAHGHSHGCCGEGEGDQPEPVTLAERLERAVDSIDRRVSELMRQAERARSIA